MEGKEFQILFTKKIKGDSLIQLKDGKILFYHLNLYNNIYIYNEKTFQKLYEINIIKHIKQYEEEKEKAKNINLYNNFDYEELEGDYWEYYFSRNVASIKEMDDGLILIGYNKYLIELKINDQNYDCKIVEKINEDILEINAITNEKIIIITEKNIFILYKNDKEYIIKEEHLIKDNWKSVSKSNPSHYYGDYDEYVSSYILPNNRLLLNFLSKADGFMRCGHALSINFSASKIIFIDLTNFEKITSTEIFNRKAEHIVLKNNIIIQVDDKITIYDINSLKIVKKINLPQIYGKIEKIYDENLIVFSKVDKGEKIIVIYTIENNDLIEKYKVKGNLNIMIPDYTDYYGAKLYNRYYLLALKDKRIIIFHRNSMNIIRINDNLNLC